MTRTLQLLEDDAKQGDSVALAEAAREHIDELVGRGWVAPADGYAKQIAYLRWQTSAVVYWHWERGIGIFRFAARNTEMVPRCGCLTMIRCFAGINAETEELTKAIRADHRLPKSFQDMAPCHYPVMAEWQRRLDAELGREPFVFEPEERVAR